MELTSRERAILLGLVESLRREFGVGEVLLYGSAARGELEEGSDIDLLLVLPELNWEIEKRIVDRCFEAELKCGRVISTLCFGVAELSEGPLSESPVVLTARREGKPL